VSSAAVPLKWNNANVFASLVNAAVGTVIEEVLYLAILLIRISSNITV
jgi:hypothetical protein